MFARSDRIWNPNTHLHSVQHRNADRISAWCSRWMVERDQQSVFSIRLHESTAFAVVTTLGTAERE